MNSRKTQQLETPLNATENRSREILLLAQAAPPRSGRRRFVHREIEPEQHYELEKQTQLRSEAQCWNRGGEWELCLGRFIRSRVPLPGSQAKSDHLKEEAHRIWYLDVSQGNALQWGPHSPTCGSWCRANNQLWGFSLKQPESTADLEKCQEIWRPMQWYQRQYSKRYFYILPSLERRLLNLYWKVPRPPFDPCGSQMHDATCWWDILLENGEKDSVPSKPLI